MRQHLRLSAAALGLAALLLLPAGPVGAVAEDGEEIVVEADSEAVVGPSDLGGLDSLYSIVQMPSGIPCATVAINGGKNAGILAAKILAVSDEELLAKLEAYTDEMKNDVMKKDEKLQTEGYQVFLKK